jgi:hypothetical protein
VRLWPENAGNARFGNVTEIEHMVDSSFHLGEDALHFPRTLALLEEDPERGLAVQVPRRDGPRRRRAAAIPHPLGRGRLTHTMQRGGDKPFHRALLLPLTATQTSHHNRHLTRGGGLQR